MKVFLILVTFALLSGSAFAQNPVSDSTGSKSPSLLSRLLCSCDNISVAKGKVPTDSLGIAKENAKLERYSRFFTAASENAETLTDWSLSLLAGSILVVIGTGYIKPANKRFRLVYLLFILGWTTIGFTIYYANQLIYRTIGNKLYSHALDQVQKANGSIRCYADKMLLFFYFSLSIFGLWLVITLLMWIFGLTEKEEN